MNTILKLATKHWLRRYKKKKIIPSVRAVFLGDVVSTQVIMDGIFSGYEIKALEQYVFPYLKGNGVALDIGANIGNHAASFSKHFKKIYAFEINKVVFHILQSNAVGTNIIPVHIGLSDAETEVSFVENFANMGASRIDMDSCDESHLVKVIPLDVFAQDNDIKDVSFVKIDVEGHELQVLNGGATFFQNQQPVIGFEALFLKNYSEGQKVQDILEGYGYTHFWEMIPQSHLMRTLKQRCPSSIMSVLKLFMSVSMQKNLVLSPCANLAGKDRELVIASTFDLK